MFRLLARFGVVLVAFVLPGQVPPADGQVPPGERPNLSGTWKLNVVRSGPILPRGTEALTMIIDHRDPLIRTSETRTVSGKTTHSEGETTTIDGRIRVKHSRPGETERSMQKWSGAVLIVHWELTDSEGVTYISDIRTTLSAEGKVLTMAEHYREPGMERIRDWVFEKQ